MARGSNGTPQGIPVYNLHDIPSTSIYDVNSLLASEEEEVIEDDLVGEELQEIEENPVVSEVLGVDQRMMQLLAVPSEQLTQAERNYILSDGESEQYAKDPDFKYLLEKPLEDLTPAEREIILSPDFGDTFEQPAPPQDVVLPTSTEEDMWADNNAPSLVPWFDEGWNTPERSTLSNVLVELSEPFREHSIATNLNKAAVRSAKGETQEFRESVYQSELAQQPEYVGLLNAIDELDAQYDEDPDNDAVWEKLTELSEYRAETERVLRDHFLTAGTILDKPDISIKQVASTIVDEPAKALASFGYELAKDPALLLTPGGWTKAGNAAYNAASKVTQSVNAVRGAQIIGGAGGAYLLNGSIAAATDTADQLANKGTVDSEQVLAQANVGGILASALSVPMVTRGAYNNTRLAAAEEKAFQVTEEGLDAYTQREITRTVDDYRVTMDSEGNLLVTSNNDWGTPLYDFNPGEATTRALEPGESAPIALEPNGKDVEFSSSDPTANRTLTDINKRAGDKLKPLTETAESEVVTKFQTLLQDKITRGDKKQLKSLRSNMVHDLGVMQDKLQDLAVTRTNIDKATRTSNRVDRNLKARQAAYEQLLEQANDLSGRIDVIDGLFARDKEASMIMAHLANDPSVIAKNGDEIARQAKESVTQLLKEEGLEYPSTQKTALTFLGESGSPEGKTSFNLFTDLNKAPLTKGWKELGVKLEDEVVPNYYFQQTKNVGGTIGAAIKRPFDFIVDLTFGKSIDNTKPLLKVSPTAVKLYNTFRHDGFSTNTDLGFFESRSKSVSNFTFRFNEATRGIRNKVLPTFSGVGENLARTVGKQSEFGRKSNEVLSVLRGETSMDPEVNSAAKGLRQILDDLYNTAYANGIKMHKMKDFVPRVYIKEKFDNEANVAEFRKILNRHRSASKKAGQELTDERIEEIITKLKKGDAVLDIDTFSYTAQSMIPSVSPHKSRSLDFIPDSELKDFLVSDIDRLFTDYIHAVTNQIEMAKAFGPKGEKLVGMLKDIQVEANAKGTDLTSGQVKRILDVINALNGNYNRMSNKVMDKATSAAVTTMHMVTLSLATVGSLAEFSLVLQKARPDDMMVGWFKGIQTESNRIARSLYRDFDLKNATLEEAAELGIVADAAIAEHLAALFGEGGGRVTNAISSTFFKSTLLHTWTNMVRTANMEAGKRSILRSMKKLSNDTLSDSDRSAIMEDLQTIGLDGEAGAQWVRDGAKVTDPYYKQVQNGMVRFVNDTMVHPEVTNRPLYFSNPHLRIFTQLLSYPVVFSNTWIANTIKGFNRGNARYKANHLTRTALSLTGLLGMSMVVNDLIEYARWGEEGSPHRKNNGFKEDFQEAIARAGLYGPINNFYNMTNSVAYGNDLTSGVAGPTLTAMNRLGKGIANWEKDDGDKFKEAVASLTPFVNMNNSFKDEFTKMMGAYKYRDTEYDTGSRYNVGENFSRKINDTKTFNDYYNEWIGNHFKGKETEPVSEKIFIMRGENGLEIQRKQIGKPTDIMPDDLDPETLEEIKGIVGVGEWNKAQERLGEEGIKEVDITESGEVQWR